MSTGKYMEIAGGKITETYKYDHNTYAGGNIILNAGKSVVLLGEEKGTKFGEPQDPPKAKEKEEQTEVKGKDMETDFDIKIELLKDNRAFLPLGIHEFRGKKINDRIKFKITIKGKGVDNWHLTIHEDDTLIYKGMSAIEEPDEVTVGGKPDKETTAQQNTAEAKNEMKRFWPEGEYEIEWDGFNTKGIYDSASFQKEHLVKITGKADGKEKSATTSFSGSGFRHDWLQSIEVNKYLKQINVFIGVALHDGGETGLNRGGDVSAEAIAYYKQAPLKQRTKSFFELRDMALAGIHNFWSRNLGNIGKGVKIGDDIFEVFVYANWDNKKGLTGPKIRFATNTSGGRSRNWELSRKLFYNVWYLHESRWTKYDPTSILYKYKGWFFQKESGAKEDFELTAAHEVGHELLLVLNGHIYSKTHKDTSTLYQTIKGDSPLPSFGEIDLMKYYNDYYVFKRTVIAERDLLGLIACFELRITEQ